MYTFTDTIVQASVRKQLHELAAQGMFVPPTAYEAAQQLRAEHHVGKTTLEIANELL